MNINSICIDFPIKLDEIFSFNFDGLKNVLEFFQKNNSIIIESIKDFNKRILVFESLKSDIDAIKIKSLNIEKTNEDINNSFNNIKEKLINLDGRLNEITKKTEENSVNLGNEKYSLENHEQNINKLNFYEKENYESIKEIKENYFAIKKKVDIDSLKLSELINKNNEAMNLIRDNSVNINKEKLTSNQQIEMINADINNINNTINNMKKISEIKNKEYDKYINDILKNLSKPYREIRSAKKSLEFAFMQNDENRDEENDLNNISKIKYEQDKKKFNDLYEEYKINKEKINVENNMNKKTIKEIQANLDKINLKLNNISNESNENNVIDFAHKIDDKFKLISENIRLLTVALNTKINKEEFESLKRDLNIRLKKLEIIKKNSIDINKNNLLALKEQKENTSMLDSKNIEYILEKIQLSLNENLTPLIKDSLFKYAKNIDLSNNLVILEVIKNNRKYLEDFDKKIMSVIDKKYKLIKDLNENLDNANEQIIKLSKSNNINHKKIKEIIKIIEGSNESDEDEDNNIDDILNNIPIKERVLRLNDLYCEVRDRIVLLEKKYSTFSREVKDDVKNNLKSETTKIVDQFKNKLSSFTYKFEDELRNKIDQIGLYSFEKKINSKLLYELKEKLDKNELKKSNNALNRKIDSLENKISKTLVDTIIDLQMDEAPLIAKKNIKNLEICASCNQILKRNNSINNESLSENKTHTNKLKIQNTKYNNMKSISIKNGFYSPNKILPEITEKFR